METGRVEAQQNGGEDDNDGWMRCALRRDPENVQRILAERRNESGIEELFVKYRGGSYRACEWVSKEAVLASENGRNLYDTQKLGAEPLFDPAYLRIEKILDVRIVEGGRKVYLVKWQNLDYDELSWEPAETLNCDEAVRAFKRWNRVPSLSERFDANVEVERKWELVKSFGNSKSGRQLQPYQVVGVNFIIRGLFGGRNVLVADEIGRNEEVCAFLRYLHVNERIQGLFLIVTRQEFIGEWEKELKEWTDLKVLSYYGIEERRNALKKYEMYYNGVLPRFNVMITTREFVVREDEFFKSFAWQCVVVDRVGTIDVVNTVRGFGPKFAIVLQQLLGNPSSRELEAIFKLLDKQNVFAYREKHYIRLDDSCKLVELVSCLRPHTIMRSRQEVLEAIEIPCGIVVECDMTEYQSGYYQATCQKNKSWMINPLMMSNIRNMKNVFQHLKKICNHPFLLRGAEAEIIAEDRMESGTPTTVCDTMLKASGKMAFLDILLARTKEERRRVAIFSAIPEMLDILEAYLRWRHYFYEKFDGSLRGEERAEAIERFNIITSPDFVCLVHLSGPKIELQRVDTVVIYDGGWSILDDMRTVFECIPFHEGMSVYRLVTESSIEAVLLDRDYARFLLTNLGYELTKISETDEIDSALKMAVACIGDSSGTELESFESKMMRSWRIVYSDRDNESRTELGSTQLSDGDDGWDLDAPVTWERFAPVIDEESYEKEVSIAQRCVMRRQGRSTRRGADEQRSILKEVRLIEDQVSNADSILKWTSTDYRRAFAVFCRFGWGRWNAIKQATMCQVPNREIRTFGHAVLRLLLEKASKPHPIIDLVFKKAISVDINDLEQQFLAASGEEIMSFIGDQADRFLEVLSNMSLINGLVGTCSNAPDDIVVPDLFPLSETWDRSDDQHLLFDAFTDGFGEFYSFQLDEISKSVLNDRLCRIVTELKKLFLAYKATRTRVSVFDHNTLKKAASMWTAEEQRKVTYYLMNYGYTTPEDFANVLGTQRSPEEVESFVNSIFLVCNNVTEYIDDLAEGITPRVIRQISERVPLFRTARELYETTKLAYDDALVLKYISESGFLELDQATDVIARFGKDMLEEKLTEFILNLAGLTRARLRLFADKSRVQPDKDKEWHKERSPRVHPIPEYETDENGNVRLPLALSGSLQLVSLGRVVTDRPGFHTPRYIYTDGFCSERLYTSITQPTEKVWYRSLILDRGGPDPVFRVEMKANPSVAYETNTPSATWLQVVRDVNRAKKSMGLPSSDRVTVSGPECYGIALPFVMQLIQRLPDADKCPNYIFRPVDQPLENIPRRRRSWQKETTVDNEE